VSVVWAMVAIIATLGVLIAIVVAVIVGVLVYKHGKKVKGKGMREVP